MMAEQAPLVVQFRQQAESAADLRALRHIFTRAMRRFAAETYAVGHLGQSGRPSGMHLNTWPRSYMELYATNGFIAEDPVVLEGMEADEAFTWEDMARRRDLSTNRVMLAARAAGFEEGFVIPIPLSGGSKGLVALASKRLRMTSADRPVVIALAQACFVISRRLYERHPKIVTLTHRERDALALVAQGCEDAAIGAVLGITRTSAHVYVERAKRRLGAATRAQAVAMAIAEGLL